MCGVHDGVYLNFLGTDSAHPRDEWKQNATQSVRKKTIIAYRYNTLNSSGLVPLITLTCTLILLLNLKAEIIRLKLNSPTITGPHARDYRY